MKIFNTSVTFLVIAFIVYFSASTLHSKELPLIAPPPLQKQIPINTPMTPLLPPPPLVSNLEAMSLNEFIRYAAKSLGKNILVSGTLDGSIDFLSNKDFNKKQMLPLLRSALELNNYALVDNGSFYSVISAKELKNHDNAYLGKRSVSGFGSKVITINYANVLPILEGVKSLLSASGTAFGVLDSKALIVSDFPDNIKLITSLIKDIDKKPIPKNTVFKSFRLVNSSADTVAQTLRSTFTTDGNISDVTISINGDTNILFAQGEAAALNRIDSMIHELDREQYQVYVQVKIIELNNDLSSKIGVKYGLDGGIVSASNFFTFAGNLGGAAIAPVNPLVFSQLTSSLGNVNQLLTIGASLDLLQNEGVSKTVSDPSILCLNNKESKVVVGKSLSFLTGNTTGSAGTSNALTRSDVGLNLTIKPLVASKDKLTLSIDAVIENVLPVLDSNNQPVTSKQQIKTDSILHHGETIVLGGFVKSYESNNDNDVPYLSDLPLIGGLFKHSEKKQQRDNLLLVITPYIIDDSKTLSSLQMDLGALGQVQKLYNDEIAKK